MLVLGTAARRGFRQAALIALGTNAASLVLIAFAALLISGAVLISTRLLGALQGIGYFVIAAMAVRTLRDEMARHSHGSGGNGAAVSARAAPSAFGRAGFPCRHRQSQGRLVLRRLLSAIYRHYSNVADEPCHIGRALDCRRFCDHDGVCGSGQSSGGTQATLGEGVVGCTAAGACASGFHRYAPQRDAFGIPSAAIKNHFLRVPTEARRAAKVTRLPRRAASVPTPRLEPAKAREPSVPAHRTDTTDTATPAPNRVSEGSIQTEDYASLRS